jgi:hypothetical protein
VPPVQVLDVTGSLEVFSNVRGYDMVVVTADGSTELQSNRGINLAGTVPHDSISGSIDTLIVAGGPGAEIVPPVGCPVKRFCVLMSFIPS